MMDWLRLFERNSGRAAWGLWYSFAVLKALIGFRVLMLIANLGSIDPRFRRNVLRADRKLPAG